MNDRLSAFCAGFGAAGAVLLLARSSPPMDEIVMALFLVGSMAMIVVGALDFWWDNRDNFWWRRKR